MRRINLFRLVPVGVSIIVSAIILSGCSDEGPVTPSESGHNSGSTSAVTITNIFSCEGKAIPENISITVDYEIGDTDWLSDSSYQIAPVFRGKTALLSKWEFFPFQLRAEALRQTSPFLPSDNAAAIHTALDGKDWSACLMFDFMEGEHGGAGWKTMVWDGSDSMTYTLNNIPAGEYAVAFLSDCGGDGDCFGIGGMTADAAGQLFTAWYSGAALSEYPTITAGPIDLSIVELPYFRRYRL